jgi:aerobic carbon-monoxide dehydrogenase medium subunit
VITKEIEFLRPASLSEALGILASRGEDVTVLSGGMSLMPMMNLGIVKPEIVMSLNGVSDLDYVETDGADLRIGAMVRHHRVKTDADIKKHAPMLAQAAGSVGDVQVRNRGTIGGSICHADPSADYMPVLAVSGAKLVLSSSLGERTVGVDEFFIDVMFTTRDSRELLSSIVVPKQPDSVGSAYVRFARVEGSFAIVNAAARVDLATASAQVALGGVGPTPVVLDVSDLFGNGVSQQGLEELGDRAYEAANESTDDVHSDAEYRRRMAGVFARRAIEAAARASKGGAAK